MWYQEFNDIFKQSQQELFYHYVIQQYLIVSMCCL